MQLDARYFDGTSLNPRHVQVEVNTELLTIRDSDGIVSSHPADRVLLMFASYDGTRVDLGIDGLKDVRLMLEGAGVRAQLTQFLPQVGKSIRGDSFGAAAKISAYLAGGALLIALIFWQLEKVAYKLVPESVEAEFGESLAEGIVLDFGGTCRPSPAEDSLKHMLARLQSESPDYRDRTFTLSVVDNKMENAFALPGGQLVLTRGLLKQAQSAEEVAGVLAHEMGHDRKRHSMRGLVRVVGLSVIGTLFSGSDVSQLAQQMVSLTYSRAMETEADEEAVVLLAAANISSLPLAGFFERHGGADDDDTLTQFGTYLSTHPASRTRMEFLKQSDTGAGAPVLTDAEWSALRLMCDTDASPSER